VTWLVEKERMVVERLRCRGAERERERERERVVYTTTTR